MKVTHSDIIVKSQPSRWWNTGQQFAARYHVVAFLAKYYDLVFSVYYTPCMEAAAEQLETRAFDCFLTAERS